MNGLVINSTKGLLKVCVIRAPEFGQNRLSSLKDLGVLLGTDIATAGDDKIKHQKIADLGKAKKVVISYVLDNVPKVPITYTRNGNPKPHCYDLADSWVIAQAGWIDCQNKKK